MNTRASRAVPFYIFLRLPFFVQSGTNFAVIPPRLSLGVAKNALTLGRTGTVKVFGTNRSDVPPRDTSTRLPRARTFYIVLYRLSLPSPCCQFSPPLIFRPFSAPTLLHANSSPRRPSLPSLCLRPLRPSV